MKALAALLVLASGAASASPRDLIAAEAERQGVPAPFALRVAWKESRHICGAVGRPTRGGRAQGPLQIMPASARGLGHRGGPLNNCGIGLIIGMRHLARCYRLAGGDERRAWRCHETGFVAKK